MPLAPLIMLEICSFEWILNWQLFRTVHYINRILGTLFFLIRFSGTEIICGVVLFSSLHFVYFYFLCNVWFVIFIAYCRFCKLAAQLEVQAF